MVGPRDPADDGSVPSRSSTGVDPGLRQNYDDAIECLVRCERLMCDLRHQLASKEQRIAALEARIVEMSLELASSKALEDERRLTDRRISTLPSPEGASEPPTVGGHIAAGLCRLKRASWGLGGDDIPELDGSLDGSSSGVSGDGSGGAPRRRSGGAGNGPNYPRLERPDGGRATARGRTAASMPPSRPSMTNVARYLLGRGEIDDAIGGEGRGRVVPPPRPLALTRMAAASESTSDLSRVIFPVSSHDCLEGLADSKDGGGKSSSDRANDEWRTLR